jgi:hypothetical protein
MRFPLTIFLSLLAAYALGFYLTVPANPEIKFWHHVVELRDAEISQVRAQHPGSPIIFFTGGSSCAFSIDPKIIEKTCGLPAFNLGLPVAARPRYLLHQALEKARKGDILVVCLEADTLTKESDYAPTTLSFGLASASGDMSSAVGGSTYGEHLSLREYLNYSRPGPSYASIWIGKAITGKGYRYSNEDIRYRGRLETQATTPNQSLAGHKSETQISSSARTLLETFQQAASRKGVKLLYSMPWFLTAESSAANNRSANLRILASIHPIIPTIDDGYQGTATDPAFFSDSGLHLTATGSATRSKALADALKQWMSQGSQ